MDNYAERLKRALANFNLEDAEALSDELYDAEIAGVVFSLDEEILWTKLTARMVAAHAARCVRA